MNLYARAALITCTILVASVSAARADLCISVPPTPCELRYQASQQALGQCTAYATELQALVSLRETDLLYVVAQSNDRLRQLGIVQQQLARSQRTLAERTAELEALRRGQPAPAPQVRPALFDLSPSTRKLRGVARKLARGDRPSIRRVDRLAGKLNRANSHNMTVAQDLGLPKGSSEAIQ